MEHPLDLAIRDQLVRFLFGSSPLDELKAQLIELTWDRNVETDPTGMHLAAQIRLALAEHSGGFSTDEELRHHLIEIHNASAIAAEIQPFLAASVGSESTKIKAATWRVLFDAPRVVVSVS